MIVPPQNLPANNLPANNLPAHEFPAVRKGRSSFLMAGKWQEDKTARRRYRPNQSKSSQIKPPILCVSRICQITLPFLRSLLLQHRGSRDALQLHDPAVFDRWESPLFCHQRGASSIALFKDVPTDCGTRILCVSRSFRRFNVRSTVAHPPLGSIPYSSTAGWQTPCL